MSTKPVWRVAFSAWSHDAEERQGFDPRVVTLTFRLTAPMCCPGPGPPSTGCGLSGRSFFLRVQPPSTLPFQKQACECSYYCSGLLYCLLFCPPPHPHLKLPAPCRRWSATLES